MDRLTTFVPPSSAVLETGKHSFLGRRANRKTQTRPLEGLSVRHLRIRVAACF